MTDKTARPGWTQEQLANALEFGVCLCGEPRVVDLGSAGLVCPFGHVYRYDGELIWADFDSRPLLG